jgi:choline dehydrogenase
VLANYDYLVVGAGSAGCVLAARLSEDPAVRVALIEAGGADNAPEIALPIAFPKLAKTKFDWDFVTEPEQALRGRRIYIPRGKALGGSSSINAMVYIRGNRRDFDEWAEHAPGWSYHELMRYFIRAEANERGPSKFHGGDGPLTVSEGRSMHPLIDHFVQAAVEAGHTCNSDFNGESQLGFGRFQLTQRDGARCSAALAYLHPARGRANLHVFSNALVTRLLFSGKRACGVHICRDDQEQALGADCEVLLCAGSYCSPQVLMLSGIGPSDHLRSLGLPHLVNLPVGENLQDHPAVAISYLTDKPSLFRAGSRADVALYQAEARGPMTSNVAEGGGFARTRIASEAPDIQFHAVPTMINDEGLTPPDDDAFSLSTCVLKPTSRGTVTLRTARPDAKPRISSNFLSTAEDRETMIAGVRMARNIASQQSLALVTRSAHRVPESDNEADIWAHVQQYAGTIYHPTSTCAIGVVVDPELRVFGVDGLRVIDASVMPSVVRGNTNAAVIAIAEKAVDLILKR